MKIGKSKSEFMRTPSYVISEKIKQEFNYLGFLICVLFDIETSALSLICILM